MEDVWRVLMVLYHSAMFFTKNNNYKKSNDLLTKGIELCSQYHITYYLARLYYQLAMNSLGNNSNVEEVKVYLNDAAAFARINSNDELLTEIEKLNNDEKVLGILDYWHESIANRLPPEQTQVFKMFKNRMKLEYEKYLPILEEKLQLILDNNAIDVKGVWSVDFLLDYYKEFWLIDMALASQSWGFHLIDKAKD